MIDTESTKAVLPTRMVGRYALFDEIGRGGVATVHIGRLVGPIGFSKTVAIKKMHESVARDSEAVAMFLDEARLAGRIQHHNVVSVLDVIAVDGEAFLVMEYVHGESLASLLRPLRDKAEAVPVRMAVQIVRDLLHGLHAAHEAKNERGLSLDLVHRDVSPQNVLVGVDGIARVLDFGIAKAIGRIQDTHTGQLKGKISYMAPEQLLGHPLDRRVDVFAAGLVLWEALSGRKLFDGESSGHVMYRVLREDAPLLTHVPESIASAVARAVSRDPSHRFASALDFARALEEGSEALSPTVIGDWVREVGGSALARRYTRLREIEATPIGTRRNATEDDPEADRESPQRTLLSFGPEDATQSEVFEREQIESSRPEPNHLPNALRLRGARMTAGVVIAGLLCAGAVLARARAGAPVQRGGGAASSLEPALNPPVSSPAPTGTADSVGGRAADSAPPDGISPNERAARAPRHNLEQPASVPSQESRPKKSIPKARTARPAVRQPEDLFSRE